MEGELPLVRPKHSQHSQHSQQSQIGMPKGAGARVIGVKGSSHRKNR